MIVNIVKIKKALRIVCQILDDNTIVKSEYWQKVPYTKIWRLIDDTPYFECTKCCFIYIAPIMVSMVNGHQLNKKETV